MKKQDMNLLERYRSEQKKKANTTSPIRIYFILISAAILILGAYALKIVLDNNSMNQEIASITEYIQNPNVVEKMNGIKKIQENIKTLDEIESEVANLDLVIDYRPKFDSKILDVIYYERPTDIKFSFLEFAENTITIEMTGKRPSDFSNYVLRLQRTYKFADVSYAGYAYDKEIGLYTGTVACIMKGGN